MSEYEPERDGWLNDMFFELVNCSFWQYHVGTRVLAGDKGDKLNEIEIMEWSPTAQEIKVKDLNKRKTLWRVLADLDKEYSQTMHTILRHDESRIDYPAYPFKEFMRHVYDNYEIDFVCADDPIPERKLKLTYHKILHIYAIWDMAEIKGIVGEKIYEYIVYPVKDALISTTEHVIDRSDNITGITGVDFVQKKAGVAKCRACL